MGLVMANPQPKNGTSNNSFLGTHTWGGKYLLKRECLPSRLMLGEHNARRFGNMFRTDHAIPDATDNTEQKQHQVRPAGSDAIAAERGERKRSENNYKIKRCNDDLQ